MCIIIDINALGPVFDRNNSSHEEFKPVLTWIKTRKRCVAYGGTSYTTELARTPKFLAVLGQLNKAGLVWHLDTNSVDKAEKAVRAIETKKDFDDPHIVAMVRQSGCQIVCTLDTRSHKYLKDRRFYERGTQRPKLFTSKGHATLLKDRNIPANHLRHLNEGNRS